MTGLTALWLQRRDPMSMKEITNNMPKRVTHHSLSHDQGPQL